MCVSAFFNKLIFTEKYRPLFLNSECTEKACEKFELQLETYSKPTAWQNLIGRYLVLLYIKITVEFEYYNTISLLVL